MKIFIISSLINALSSLACSIFLLSSNAKSPLNRSLSYFSLSVTAWSSSYFIAILASNAPDSILLAKITNSLSSLIPITFFHFTCQLTEIYEKHKQTLYSLYIIVILIISSIFITNDLIIFDAQPISVFKYWPVAGKYYYILILEHVVLISISLFFIFKKSKSCKSNNKSNLRIIFWGTMIAYIGGATNFPILYKVPIIPIGNILVCFYTIAVTYAIVKHSFTDVKATFQKSLVYSVLITIVFLFCIISVYIIENVLKEVIGYQSIYLSMLLASCICLTINPLKNLIQEFIEKLLFKQSFIQIASQNEKLMEVVSQTERMRMVATLASGLAHEIKNPLTPLKTFTEYLPHKLDDKEFLLKFSKIASREVERIDNLVHELLSFAKPQLPNLKPTKIHIFINNTLDLLNNNLLKNNIKVIRSFHSTFEQEINIDANQIKQALLNIFLNAIEAMPKGGTLIIATSLYKETSLLITIQDTGSGIDPKDIAHIFDPFFTKKDNGTGLGLSITHEIIKNHNGKINVESKVNCGTTFKIELPL